MATKTQKINFINERVLVKGKRISKKELRMWNDKNINALIKKFSKEFTEWLNTPKLIKFLIDGKKDNSGYSYTYKAESEEKCREIFTNEGIEILRIAPAAGNHRCMYCDNISYGTQKDILCENCREMFGHYSFYEL